ncbi:MAG: ABC transporter permease [Nitrospiraceae bacterium]|nr:MAG: ABC transporter permease [Nitrospiraceae bacterium]
MKPFNIHTFAIRNLKRKKFRTGVLAFSITLIVAVLVFGFSFISSISLSIRRASDRLGSDLIVVPVGARGYAEEVLLESKIKSFYMDKDIAGRVKTIEGVQAVTFQTYLTTIQGLCCDIPEATVVAFNQETDFIVRPWLEKAIGRKLGKNEAIVGHESFLNIGLGLMDAVLFGTKFRILGALEKSGTGLDNAIFISDENVEEILQKGKTPLGPDQISIIFVKVKKGYDPYVVGRNIEGEIVEADVVTRSDIGKGIISTLKDINMIFSITVLMASVLSVLLAWAIFSAIVNERLREVGIMRAIGAKESHILRLFFTEVLVIGTIGSVCGTVLGTSLSLLLLKSFSLLKNLPSGLNMYDRVIIGVSGLLTGTGICILGALSPVRRIKKLEPLLVIKGEAE